jgi:hypothetical protein
MEGSWSSFIVLAGHGDTSETAVARRFLKEKVIEIESGGCAANTRRATCVRCCQSLQFVAHRTFCHFWGEAEANRRRYRHTAPSQSPIHQPSRSQKKSNVEYVAWLLHLRM